MSERKTPWRVGDDYRANGADFDTFGISAYVGNETPGFDGWHDDQIEVHGDSALRDKVLAFLLADAAVAAVNALGAEPAGWQCQDDDGAWRYRVEPSEERAKEAQARRLLDGVPVRPLYTHPPDAAAEIAQLRQHIARVEQERDAAKKQDYRTVTLGGMSLLDQINRARAQRDELADDLVKAQARATAALATAKRDAWIAGRDAAIAELNEVSWAPFGHDNPEVCTAFDTGSSEALKDAETQICALTPPAVADGGRDGA